MTKVNLTRLHSKEEKERFIREVQEAFQVSYDAHCNEGSASVLKREAVEESFIQEGAEVYFAEIGGKEVGGALIVFDEASGIHELHFLYVKSEAQNHGYGKKLWQAIEHHYPKAKVWEVYTPYHDKRNIHFYVNRCGFKIVEFFNPYHKDPHPNSESDPNLEENQCFFRFEKEMREF